MAETRKVRFGSQGWAHAAHPHGTALHASTALTGSGAAHVPAVAAMIVLDPKAELASVVTGGTGRHLDRCHTFNPFSALRQAHSGHRSAPEGGNGYFRTLPRQLSPALLEALYG